MNDKDVVMQWRSLFLGKEITSLILDQADELVDRLGPESPLRIRLSTELEELRTLHKSPAE